MKTEDIPNTPITMWHPEENLETVAIVGKLGEESCELAGKCARICISGIDQVNPSTGNTNRAELLEEIADVHAMILHTMERLKLDSDAMHDRSIRKYVFKTPWFNFLKGVPRPKQPVVRTMSG